MFFVSVEPSNHVFGVGLMGATVFTQRITGGLGFLRGFFLGGRFLTLRRRLTTVLGFDRTIFSDFR